MCSQEHFADTNGGNHDRQMKDRLYNGQRKRANSLKLVHKTLRRKLEIKQHAPH